MSRRLFKYVIFGAFLAAAVAVYLRTGGGGEIVGYDYGTFLGQMRDPGWIFYTGARHPGLGLVTSPIVLAASGMRLIGERAADLFLLAVFAGIATLNAALILRLGGALALGLWLVFGLTWIGAAVPESFPIAQTTLLVALVVADCGSRTAEWGEKAEDRARLLPWAWIAAVASMVTVTNGLKVALAAFLGSAALRRRWKAVLTVVAVVAVAAAAFFAVRMALWNARHPDEPKTVIGALQATASWIPTGLSFTARSRLVAANLFIRPVMPVASWWSDFAQPPALTVFNGLWAALVWMAALAGTLRRWNDPVVRVAGAFFAVDLAIHAVCGWGLAEGWIFSAHYLPLVAIIVGRFLALFPMGVVYYVKLRTLDSSRRKVSRCV